VKSRGSQCNETLLVRAAVRPVAKMEKSAARQVGDIVEWTKVLWCESMQDFLDHNGNLALNLLKHMQPVKADKRVGDVVRSTQMICQSLSRVQH